MKKKILTLMLGGAVFATSPAFAMNDEMTDVSRTFIHQSTSNSNIPTLNELLEESLLEALNNVPMAFQGFHFVEPSASGKFKISTNKPKIVSQAYLDLLQKQADSGSDTAQYLLGNVYRTGAYTVEKLKNDLEILQILADSGNGLAQYYLGKIDMEGKYAGEYDIKNCFVRDGIVQHETGFLSYGCGFKQPISNAPQKLTLEEFNIIKNDAEQGEVTAQRKLGDLYWTGAHLISSPQKQEKGNEDKIPNFLGISTNTEIQSKSPPKMCNWNLGIDKTRKPQEINEPRDDTSYDVD